MKSTNVGLFKIIFIILFVSTSAQAVGKKLPPNLIPGSDGIVQPYAICGDIDWQHVEQYDGTLGPSPEFVRAHEQAVGWLIFNGGICTGTLLPNDRFLTAGHCLTPEGEDLNDVITDTVLRSSFVVFNYQLDEDGNTSGDQYFSYTVQGVEEHTYVPGGMDYSILKLNGNPGWRFPVARINSGAFQQSQMLTVIGHPGSQAATSHKVIDSGTLGALGSGVDGTLIMAYDDLDTIEGVSGAGLLNDKGYLVGVHIGSTADENGDGICTSIAAREFNYGIPISELVEVSPILRELEQSYQYGHWNTFWRVKWANTGETDWLRNRSRHYMYVDTSSGAEHKAGERAELVSHPFEVSDETISFDYSMFGQDIGTLKLEAFRDNTWTTLFERKGSRSSNAWASATVDLAPFSGDTIRVRFTAIANRDWAGDIAINNVYIQPTTWNGKTVIASIFNRSTRDCSTKGVAGGPTFGIYGYYCENIPYFSIRHQLDPADRSCTGVVMSDPRKASVIGSCDAHIVVEK